MKICLISTAAIPTPPQKYGGIERAVAWLTKGLMEVGNEVLIVCGHKSTIKANAVETAKYEEDFVPLLKPWIEQGAFDVIIDMSHNKLVTRKWQEYPQINVWQVTTLTWDKNPVFISKAQAKSLGRPDAPVIYYGLDQSEYPFRGVACPEGPLLYMGALIKFKRPHLVAEAAKLLGKEAILVGPPYDPSYWPVLEDLKMQDHVQIREEVGGQDKLDLLRTAGCLVHPVGAESWVEAGAIVALEAWLMGLPIVATANGCLPEYIIEDKNGFLAEPTAEDIAEKVSMALSLSATGVMTSFNARHFYQHMAMEYMSLAMKVEKGETW